MLGGERNDSVNPSGQSLLKSLGRSLLAGGILLASIGVLPAAAAPGVPSSPSRVSLPASPVKAIGTPTLPAANRQVTTPADSVGKLVGEPTPNPRVSLPAGSLPKAHIPSPPHLAAATDDGEQQVLVFAVDTTGVLKTVVKQPDSTLDPTAGEPDGFWGAAFGLSGAIFPADASLAAVYHPTNKAMDVFGVDNNGALQDVRREKLTFGTPFWQPPVPLTGPGFAEPGAPVAAVWQPLNDQLEVYVVGTNGAVMGVWNENNGAWKPAFNLTDAGFAPRSSQIAAAWAPSSEMLEVFVADNSGSLKGIWKLHDRAWQTPETITGPGFMSAGGPVAALWEPSNSTLDVFTVDQNGTAKVTSKHHLSAVPLPLMPWGRRRTRSSITWRSSRIRC
jgi:hypothetical protein